MKSISNIYSSGSELYSSLGRNIYTRTSSFLINNATTFLLILGVALLVSGVVDLSIAQDAPGDPDDTTRLNQATSRALDLVEGPVGALFMIFAGIVAIVAAVMGAYKLAISLLIVAVGAFILRNLITIWFNFEAE